MTRVAIFDRNHTQYLDEACDWAQRDPNRPVTFRSRKRWSRAERALAEQDSVRILFSANGAQGMVGYEARLLWTVKNPSEDDPETKRALQYQLDSTCDEHLWENEGRELKTLVVISRCRRIAEPFHMSQLVKASEKMEPISKDYGYGYVPIWDPNDIGVFTQPDEIGLAQCFKEGSVRLVRVNAYERNPKARADCLRHYGYDCLVCGVNFEEKYGDIGRQFIHVHHVVPISAIGSRYVIDPVQDLRPICPNCHAMVHKTDPPLSVEELREQLKSRTG